MPQLRRSVAVVVHTPLQLTWPTAQLGPPPPVPPMAAVPPVAGVPPVPVPDAPPVPVPPSPLSPSPVGVSACGEQLPTKRNAPAAIAAITKRACMARILTQDSPRAQALEGS